VGGLEGEQLGGAWGAAFAPPTLIDVDHWLRRKVESRKPTGLVR
jgi:hypothetical protein